MARSRSLRKNAQGAGQRVQQKRLERDLKSTKGTLTTGSLAGAKKGFGSGLGQTRSRTLTFISCSQVKSMRPKKWEVGLAMALALTVAILGSNLLPLGNRSLPSSDSHTPSQVVVGQQAPGVTNSESSFQNSANSLYPSGNGSSLSGCYASYGTVRNNSHPLLQPLYSGSVIACPAG